MSETILAALLGIVGGLLGSIVGYVATMRATDRQLEEMKRQMEAERKEREQDRREREQDRRERTRDNFLSSITEFLTEYTAQRIKNNTEDLHEFEHRFEMKIKELYGQGNDKLAIELSPIMGRYLSALRQYAAETITSDKLHDARISTRNEIGQVMLRYMRG
jgi:gas vesicle protein